MILSFSHRSRHSPAQWEARRARPDHRSRSHIEEFRLAACAGSTVVFRRARREACPHRAVWLGQAHEPQDPAIGRASCRERVCKYVYISVVAVPLKQTMYTYMMHRAKTKR